MPIVLLPSSALTQSIIGASMEVHRSLGPGFLESIYKKALLHELHLRQLATTCEFEVEIAYKDQIVGKHRLDLFVEGQVVVELKAITSIGVVHMAQILSYMKAVRAGAGLIINFGEERLRWKRIINQPRI